MSHLVHKCAICGSGHNRMIVDQFNALAYCTSHQNYINNVGMGGRKGECPSCHYRFDRGNAEWYFRKKEDAKCISCGESLNTYNVNRGVLYSVFSQDFERSHAIKNLSTIIKSGANNPHDEIIVDYFISSVRKKWFLDSINFVSLENFVDAIIKVKGPDSKKILKNWGGIFSRIDKSLKKVVREKLKQL